MGSMIPTIHQMDTPPIVTAELTRRRLLWSMSCLMGF